MDKISFDQLPNEVALLRKEISEMRELMAECIGLQGRREETDELLTVEEVASFLKLKVPTVYSKVSRGELPVYKAPGCRTLFFQKEEVKSFIKSGRKLTNEEQRIEMERIMSSRKKGLHNGK